MAGVTIQEYGLRFIKVCMEQYWGSCLFPLLFAAGLLWSLFYKKQQVGKIFLCCTVFLILTVYNPFLVKYIVPKVHFENEYYRMIWLLPVIPGVAYFAVRLIFAMKYVWLKTLTALILAGVLIYVGTPIPGIVTDFARAENLYKVPNELRSVCDVIHQDSEEENPRVVFDINLNTYARQYDASLQLVLNRNAVLYRAGSQVSGVTNPDSAWYKRQRIIMDVVYYEQPETVEKFCLALNRTKTDYLVLPVTLSNHDFIRSAGCVAIAQTSNYVVYKYLWE